ncbi:Glycosyltransferase involved in cell wall bisynthesis [Flavobacterium caeni]|uniref:Glycosyltransferase involved in cell wall bisynthesis n=2 Tax=Flavobacterium caeni TaxID=490189 RepID=A0A1G5GFC4_9FLAO|nr:Glycosyltransferase involved in cell wall bisynthesis [Flavobacterium caeni]
MLPSGVKCFRSYFLLYVAIFLPLHFEGSEKSHQWQKGFPLPSGLGHLHPKELFVICGMQNVLIIGFVWPEPNSSAAGTRMMQLIELFLEQDWKVTFGSTAADSEFAFDVTSIGVEKVSIELNNASFDTFVKKLDPTIVLFDRFLTEEQFGWRVAEQCPNALRVLDTEDLHSLRAARQLAVKEQREFSTADLFSDVAKREMASIFRSDLSLIIAEFEMDLLRDFFKVDEKLLYYLPFMADECHPSDWPAFEEREDFIFIGNFLHEPNWHTVQYLKTEIWPRIRKLLPDASLKIYGAYPSQKVLQLHNPSERFHIMGRAANAAEVVRRARVVLAPIQFGAGAKGKLLEAMQCGTPSVTTTIGAESMAGDLPWNGTIANHPDEFAKAAVALYNDQNLWQQSQRNGLSIIAERYAKEKFAKSFLGRIGELADNLPKHRAQNFIGAMLQHQTLASTKYMAKWIELKNKPL